MELLGENIELFILFSLNSHNYHTIFMLSGKCQIRTNLYPFRSYFGLNWIFRISPRSYGILWITAGAGLPAPRRMHPVIRKWKKSNGGQPDPVSGMAAILMKSTRFGAAEGCLFSYNVHSVLILCRFVLWRTMVYYDIM